MATSVDKVYEFGEWRLDPAEHLLLRNGSAVPLGPKVFDTLLLLVESAGRLVTKDEFMNRVWPDSFVEDLALTQNISQLSNLQSFWLDDLNWLAAQRENVNRTFPPWLYGEARPVRRNLAITILVQRIRVVVKPGKLRLAFLLGFIWWS